MEALIEKDAVKDEPATKNPGAEHFDRIAKEAERVLNMVRDTRDLLRQADRMLVLAGEVLNVSQPVRKGKLGIRWWRQKPNEDRVPVLVVWDIGRNGRFYPRKITDKWLARRVRSDGDFSVNVEVTEKVVGYVTECLRVRAMLRARMGKIKVMISRSASHWDTLDFQVDELLKLREKASENIEVWENRKLKARTVRFK